MVLNDAGTIGLSLNGKSFPGHAGLRVQTGDWVLVHYYNEGLQIHPMHLHQFPQLVYARTASRSTSRTGPTPSTSLPASATRCCSRPPNPACGCGTATS